MTSTLRTLPLAVALVVSVLLTSFALTLSPRVAEAATTPDYRACPDVLVLGARGSSESPQNWTSSSAFTRDPFLGLGENVYGVYDRLMRSAPHLRIEARAVQYVASPVPANPLLQPAFLESVRGGVLLLVNQVKYVERTCTGANVRYVFAGYSQGAWVVQGALAQLQALPGVSRRTVGVVQFGNPHFLPAGQEVVRFKAENTLAGLATRHYTRIPLPEGFKTKTASYCLPKDPVCQMWPTRGPADPLALSRLARCAATSPTCAHFQYSPTETLGAAAWLKPRLPAVSVWPRISAGAAPAGRVADPYSFQPVVKGGPTSTYAWAIAGGALPAGLTLAPTTGRISGVPKVAGTYAVTLRASNTGLPGTAFRRHVTAGYTFRIASAAAATTGIAAIRFTGSPADPTVTISGGGFGTLPVPSEVVAAPGYTGSNYGNSLYLLSDLHSGLWGAGQNDGRGNGHDYIGLVVSAYSDTLIRYSLGSAYTYYRDRGLFSLDQGDPFTVVVGSYSCTGAVSYAVPVVCTG